MKAHAHARKPASHLPRATSSPEPAHGHEATSVWVRQILHGPRLQPKLTVGPPDDAYEREADRVAVAVMRMPEPAGLGSAASGAEPPRIQRMYSECEEEMQRQPLEESGKEALQAKEAPGQIPEVTPELETSIGSLRGSGSPLPASERAFFESRFGSDFASVQVHTGSGAADLAQRVQARAFTIGRSVVFGQGEYRPGTDAGRRLLAHELTHVIQQSGGDDAADGELQKIDLVQRWSW